VVLEAASATYYWGTNSLSVLRQVPSSDRQWWRVWHLRSPAAGLPVAAESFLIVIAVSVWYGWIVL